MSTCSNSDKTIDAFRGRDRTIRVTLTGPGDISGYKVWFSVKERKEDATALIHKSNTAAGGSDSQILITDGPNGVLEIYLGQADTDLDPCQYWYDVLIENLDGQRSQGVVPAHFVVKQAVTSV